MQQVKYKNLQEDDIIRGANGALVSVVETHEHEDAPQIRLVIDGENGTGEDHHAEDTTGVHKRHGELPGTCPKCDSFRHLFASKADDKGGWDVMCKKCGFDLLYDTT